MLASTLASALASLAAGGCDEDVPPAAGGCDEGGTPAGLAPPAPADLEDVADTGFDGASADGAPTSLAPLAAPPLLPSPAGSRYLRPRADAILRAATIFSWPRVSAWRGGIDWLAGSYPMFPAAGRPRARRLAVSSSGAPARGGGRGLRCEASTMLDLMGPTLRADEAPPDAPPAPALRTNCGGASGLTAHARFACSELARTVVQHAGDGRRPTSDRGE